MATKCNELCKSVGHYISNASINVRQLILLKDSLHFHDTFLTFVQKTNRENLIKRINF